MTLEMNFGQLEPKTLAMEIEFHRTRMITFENEARGLAMDADAIMKRYTDKAETPSQKAEAVQNGINNPARKAIIDQQQMYERWTMREATIVTALTNYALLEEARDARARESNIGLKMEELDSLRKSWKEYRLRIVRAFVKKGAGK